MGKDRHGANGEELVVHVPRYDCQRL
jgi:hypothetical protein